MPQKAATLAAAASEPVATRRARALMRPRMPPAAQLHPSAYFSIRQHTSAYVSIRQHTSAYVSTCAKAAAREKR
jgi:hypothetical protein